MRLRIVACVRASVPSLGRNTLRPSRVRTSRAEGGAGTSRAGPIPLLCEKWVCAWERRTRRSASPVTGLWLKCRDDIFSQPPSVSGEAGFCVFCGKNARRYGGIAIVRVPRYALEYDSGLSAPADCGRISVLGLQGGRMKRFFRRADCAPSGDSRRRGVVLCHLAGAHRASASDLKGLDPHFHVDPRSGG